jgi:hypothetical protein
MHLRLTMAFTISLFIRSLPELNQKVYQGIKDEKIVAEPAE